MLDTSQFSFMTPHRDQAVSQPSAIDRICKRALCVSPPVTVLLCVSEHVCAHELITCMLMTVCICIHVYIYIFVGVVHVVWGQVCSRGDWAVLKALELPLLQGLLFSSLINAVSTMEKCHCSFLWCYLLFGVHHSVVINDPLPPPRQQRHPAGIHCKTVRG